MAWWRPPTVPPPARVWILRRPHAVFIVARGGGGGPPRHLFAPRPAHRLLPTDPLGQRRPAPARIHGGARLSGDLHREQRAASGEAERIFLDAGANPPRGVIVT